MWRQLTALNWVKLQTQSRQGEVKLRSKKSKGVLQFCHWKTYPVYSIRRHSSNRRILPVAIVLQKKTIIRYNIGIEILCEKTRQSKFVAACDFNDCVWSWSSFPDSCTIILVILKKTHNVWKSLILIDNFSHCFFSKTC